MPSIVELRPVTREDVQRLSTWLDDPDVSESWFGRYTYGDPAHLGYEPKNMIDAIDIDLGEDGDEKSVTGDLHKIRFLSYN